MRYESGTKSEVLATAIDMAIQYENDFIAGHWCPVTEEYFDDPESLKAVEEAKARVRDFKRLLKSSLCR